MKPGEPLVPDEFTDELIRETAVAEGLPFFVEDESALDRFATLMAHASPGLASATPDPSSAVRRGAVDGSGIGAAGPRDIDDAAVRGSAARVVNVGRSGVNRPAAPPTNKRPAARTTGLKNNAALKTRREGA